jgi:Family of unknown function (DUF6209)
MVAKAYVGTSAQITFTSDFHELLEGDLLPGESVTLRYDPRRIVPPEDPFVFGSPRSPVNAFVQFREDGPVSREILASPAGIVAQPTFDISGQGSMLVATVDVPGDADQVAIWFSFLAASGEMHFDNDGGKNYCFRFPSADAHVVEATVVSDAAKRTGEFALSVAVIDAVEAVSVRFRIAGNAEFGHPEVSLSKTTGKDKQKRTIWSASGISVPFQSSVQFKIFYWLRGTRYKDDNGSRYYLAPEPPAEKVPPPPKELAAAARAWKL